MDNQQLTKITQWLVYHFFRNSDIIYPLSEDEMMIAIDDKHYVSVIDIVASLHNLLCEQVTGNRYDYMFHWLNKIGYDCEDDIFDDILKGSEENENH